MSILVDAETAERVARLELPFNSFGFDPYGISREAVARAMSMARLMYRKYFKVTVRGLEHVPPRGRAMLVGNHSGGVALDAAIVISAVFFDLDPPRLAQGMAEKFINRTPFLSKWANRTGHFTGLPEHAARLLRDERLLLVFPEGARGTAKLYPERHSLVQFGTGFMRLALETRTPIIPFAFLGGGDAIPTVFNAYKLGRAIGAPYIPFTPWIVPIPLPVRLDLRFGPPMHFEGTGSENDDAVSLHVDRVKQTISQMIDDGLAERSRRYLTDER
jgi:1-acyl-sn-glycerol-3-phosphate acyltransferase